MKFGYHRPGPDIRLGKQTVMHQKYFSLLSVGFFLTIAELVAATPPARKVVGPVQPAKKSVARPAAKTARKRPAPAPRVSPAAAAISEDQIDGEDLMVRRAAVDALGPRNGTVVAMDPQTGRVLTIVNQKMALKSGFRPCSTIKLVAALAGLSEGMIDRNTRLALSRRVSMDLTEALAHSNNPYFAQLGVRLGYERISYYAKLLGLGEKAGLDIEGEEPGIFPAAPAEGGMGMMTSFGIGINLTPLELASLLGAISNGGTMYYLQHPRSQEAIDSFVPRVKRHLDIQPFIPELKPGMLGAVEYGTARAAAYNPNEPIFGKTGSCSDYQYANGRLGWFGAFNEAGKKKLVVVVVLTGGTKSVSGPTASAVAGSIFKTLSQSNFYAQAQGFSPASMAGSGSCCSQ
jgi:penicillin-binding protein 2